MRREVRVGQRVIYEHEKGGFNALITAVKDPSVQAVNLVFVNPSNGAVETKEDVPNTHFALEEREVPKLVGEKGKKKLETVKQMCSIANGHWRR